MTKEKPEYEYNLNEQMEKNKINPCVIDEIVIETGGVHKKEIITLRNKTVAEIRAIKEGFGLNRIV